MSGFKIQNIHAYISVDPKDGDEGLIGVMAKDGVMVPLISADEKRLESMKAAAQYIVDITGVPAKLVRFQVGEEVDRLTPKNVA